MRVVANQYSPPVAKTARPTARPEALFERTPMMLEERVTVEDVVVPSMEISAPRPKVEVAEERVVTLILLAVIVDAPETLRGGEKAVSVEDTRRPMPDAAEPEAVTEMVLLLMETLAGMMAVEVG